MFIACALTMRVSLVLGGRAPLAHGMVNICDNMMIMIGEFTVHDRDACYFKYFTNVNLFLLFCSSLFSGKGIFQLRH